MQKKSGIPAKKKPGRVSLPPSSPLTTPTKGNFFAGLGPSVGAPARNTNIPNLTEKVAVAKARVTALKDAGLVPQAEREAAVAAQQIIDKAKDKPRSLASAPGGKANQGSVSPPKPSAAKSPVLPAWLTKPAVALDQPRQNAPTRLPPASPTRRGAPPPGPRAGMAAAAAKNKNGNLLGALKDAASVGLGTALETAASVPGTLLTPIHPGATRTPTENIKPTHLGPAITDTTQRLANASNKAASGLSNAGLSLPKTIPSVDLVAPAGAASTQMTPQKLVAAGLTEQQTKRFRALAKKKGWYDGEINGLVGLDLIKHAYSKPPPLPLRVLQNFGSGVIRTGALPVVPVALAKEVASGHGLRAAKELGEVAAEQFGGMLSNPGQAAVSDPYAFLPVAGGTLKTLGGIGGKVAEKMGREAAERSVTHAVTGAEIPRGPQARNLYTATGQLISDKATSKSAVLSRRADAKSVDDLVRDVSNATAPLHHGVQTDYAKAFKSVGAKRAELLSSINKAGGKPEKILAKYQRDGNARQVKHWGQVVEASKNLTDKDAAFLAAHRALGAQTTGTHVELGRFSDTAGIYRSHQPLILSDAHAGDPGAQRVQALHEEWVTALRTGKTDRPTASPAQDAKLATIESQAKKHEDEYGRYERAANAGSGELAVWREKGKEIRSRTPNEPANVTRLRAEAKSARAISDGHGGADAERAAVEAESMYQQALKEYGKNPKVKAWRAEVRAYRKAKPVVSSTREHTAKAKMQVHRSQADKLNARAEEIRASQRARAADLEDSPDALFSQYDQAVRDYAATHLANGGAEPTRVAYTPAAASGVFSSPYTKGTGGKVRFNQNMPRQQASTGGSFESGNYLIDPKVALRENLQAQRLRTSVGLTSDESLAKIGAIKATQGDVRPEGYVFTPKQNPATVGKVISDLHDQPVGAHDYYHQESSIRDRFAKSLEHDADTHEYAKTDGWFVPEGSWNRILDYTRPESRQAYDRFMRQYQRAMISIYPSTMLGNTVGSTPLAMVAGAGPKSFNEARRSSSLKGDPTLVPFTAHGRGVAGNLAADARNPLSRQMNRNRRVNVIGEDFSRDAVYFSHVLPGSTKRAKELGYKNRDDYFRDLASGKVDVHLRDQALKKVIKFVGDAAKPTTQTGRIAGKVILFPQWVIHMSKLMLVTLPIEHPRRMALINTLAAYGDQYRKEHGALPGWMQEFAPLFTREEGGQEFTRIAGLGQLAPQGTAGGIFDDLTRDAPLTDRVIGLTNPPVAAALKTALQIHDNPDSDYPVDLRRFIANQALYTIPGMSKFFPRTNMESTSLPWDPQRYTIPYRDVDGNRHETPWAMRGGARPVGGPLGIASRVFGLPLYDVPTPDSTINKRANRTAKYKAKNP